MQIGRNLPAEISIPNIDYLNKYVPNLSSDIEQFPIGRFYPQCDELVDHKIQTDLMNDSFLSKFLKRLNLSSPKVPKFLKTRREEMAKQDVCRKLFNYAKKIDSKPSLILSHYEFTNYIERCHGKLSEFWRNSGTEQEYVDISCDLALLEYLKANFHLNVCRYY